MVEPRNKRQKVLTLAHDHNGYLGHKKALKMIQRLFVLPGMHRDVVASCTQRERCPKTRKTSSPKAPLQPIPVITEPYEKMVFDIVGPFPRTKDSIQVRSLRHIFGQTIS